MIRVVVAEDQAMVLGALAALLEIERDIDVVGQVRDGREALHLIAKLKPDVVLTDVEMPVMTGLELAGEVARKHAATRVIILTTFAAPATCVARWTPVRAGTAWPPREQQAREKGWL